MILANSKLVSYIGPSLKAKSAKPGVIGFFYAQKLIKRDAGTSDGPAVALCTEGRLAFFLSLKQRGGYHA